MTEPVQRIAVLVERRAQGGFVVIDPRGEKHYAHSDHELGEAIAALTLDPTMPRYTQATTNETESIIEQAATILVADQLPENMRHVAPQIGRAAASTLGKVGERATHLFQELAERRRRNRAERQQKQEQQEQKTAPKTPPKAPKKPNGTPRVEGRNRPRMSSIRFEET